MIEYGRGLVMMVVGLDYYVGLNPPLLGEESDFHVLGGNMKQ